LRISSGIAKGISLKCPAGLHLRPTSARVRQAVFSAIHEKIPGSSVLDLFAGTGAMGIEALSRGANNAVFVELSSTCFKVIRQNLQLTRLSHKASVIKGNVLRIVRRLGRDHRKFDIVIADPPYHRKTKGQSRESVAEKTLNTLVDSDILHKNSLVVVEHSAADTALHTVHALRILSTKKHGGTSISIFCPAKRDSQ
jgi:16S rRNA (guanine966-N2)-methyltransferase